MEVCSEFCLIEWGMCILGGKWIGLFLWYLKDGLVCFNDFVCMLGGVSKKMIVECLC